MTTPIIEARRQFYGERPREIRVREFEIRTGENGQLGLDGYASLTGVPYIVSDWLGDYTETIDRGAFGKALAERDDTRLLVNHDGIPLARTASGTMLLTEDERGLHVDVPELDDASPLVQTVRSAMARGDMNQMSFAFKATRQEWNEDYSERTIKEVRLFDVSVVTYPASPTTTAKLRSGSIEPIMQRLQDGKRLTPLEIDTLYRALAIVGRDSETGEEERPETDAQTPVDANRRLALAKAKAAAALL